MNTQLICALCIGLASGAAIPPLISPIPISLNVTEGDLELFVTSAPGIISYGSPESIDRVLFMPWSVVELDKNEKINSNITLLNTTLWTLGSVWSTDVEGVNATALNLTTTLPNNKTEILVSALLFNEDGMLSQQVPGLNVSGLNVTAGALKVNMEIRNWQFCSKANKKTGCKGKGQWLQLDIAFKGLLDTIEMITNNTWSIGEGLLLWLDPEVMVDNKVRPSLNGLPTIVDANSTSIFPISTGNNSTTNFIRVAFPRFSRTATWDFLVWF
jgi:hypothetical protein